MTTERLLTCHEVAEQRRNRLVADSLVAGSTPFRKNSLDQMTREVRYEPQVMVSQA
jgi:hypothetical protein